VSDSVPFAELVLIAGVVGLLALLSSRVSERIRLPSPILFLAASAAAVHVIPALHAPTEQVVERVVTVALVCILFDGGMHIGWGRFRAAAAPIVVVGVLGTFLTVAAAALFCHVAFGLSWYVSVLAGTAIALPSLNARGDIQEEDIVFLQDHTRHRCLLHRLRDMVDKKRPHRL